MIKRLILSCIALTLIVAGIGVIIIGTSNNKTLVLFESTPKATVYIDGDVIGETPVEFETQKRNIQIELIPVSGNDYLPYETELSLTPQTKVIVRRNLGNADSKSSGQLFQFVETHKNSAEMTFITNPINSLIYVDNEYIGNSPIAISPNIGSKLIKIEKGGYVSQSFEVQNALGYNVLVYADLTLSEAKTSIYPEAIATILSTPFGFLNVRRAPSNYSSDITRVFAGREYKVLGFSDKKDWINISLNASESGWISSQFASVSGQTATPP